MLKRVVLFLCIPFFLLPSGRTFAHVHDCQVSPEHDLQPHIHLGHHHDHDADSDDHLAPKQVRFESHDDDALYVPVWTTDADPKPQSVQAVVLDLVALRSEIENPSPFSSHNFGPRPQPPPDPCPVYLRQLTLLI